MSPSSTKTNVHRPGALKQQNKPFKTGRHRSQHEIKRNNKGRVAEKKHQRSLKRLNLTTKANRSHQAIQLRKQKLVSEQQKRQIIGSLDGVPQIITLISLSSNLNLFSVVELLIKCFDDPRSTDVPTQCGARVFTSSKLRAKFCFLTPNGTNLENLLDAAQLSDTILYLVSSTNGISLEGDYLLDLIDQHCSSSNVIYSLLSTNSDEHISSSSKHSTTKDLQKFLQKRSSDAKFVSLDNEQDAQRLLRKFTEMKINSTTKKCLRPYLFAEQFQYENPQSSTSTLKLSGYLRGVDLSVNDLVYLPGLGTFQLDKIEENRFERGSDGQIGMAIQSTLLPSPSLQKSLIFEAEKDPNNADEQTWPTNEEIQQAEKQFRVKKIVPKGTSEYQAAWIVSDEEQDEDDDDQQSNNDEHDEDDQMNINDQHIDDHEDDDEEEEEEMEELVINTNKYDENLDDEEEKQTLKKIRDAKLDEEFPDQIDTPQDIPARVRFQKYRGLKSFRTTKWDPKENLPEDYSRIYQFPNFRSMVKQIQLEQQQKLRLHSDDSAHVHRYVTLYVKDVPFHRFDPGFHLFATGLLPHEQCLSVLNILLTRPSDNQCILKSKEPLLFYVGHRRFLSAPIYSQHTQGNKHKFERYFRPGQTLVATCFGPISYPPTSVLAFKQHPDGREELVGQGSLISVNPDRIILKRIVLSGHPLKIQKSSAVVRYMFFNPDDVNWFKPIELRTRWGRRGHIKESLGTHGHMKCQFDGIVKSQDTILMNLYKRVFPKWIYQSMTFHHQQQQQNEEKME